MKITVIGSGSIFFTRQMVRGMATSEALRNAELALVDIDEHKCVQMGRFCQQISDFYGANLKITYTTDRKAVLPGSDYVVLTFAQYNYHYRETGTILAKNHGINLVSGETAGPSAVFRILRTVAPVLEVARDIEALCPQAVVINYVNPTNVIGTALTRYTKLNAYAFCDGFYGGMNRRIFRLLGEPRDERDPLCTDLTHFSYKLGGLNHFTFLWGLARGGEDLWGRVRDALRAEAEAAEKSNHVRAEWDFCEAFDAWNPLGGHLVEYVRYFQGKGGDPQHDFVVSKWDLNRRIRWMKHVWFEIEACNSGTLPINETMRDVGGANEMVADLIESMVCDQGRTFTVNIRNGNTITNLPADTHVEVLGRFYKDHVETPPVGELPRGLAGLMHPIIDEQELALEAALTGNLETAIRAVACDPLVMSLSDARRLVHEHLALEETHVGDVWDTYWAA
jgi:alpha-galactosidase